MADLRYVVAINFETTCNEIQGKPEIIEFAAVLYDLRSGGHTKDEFLEVVKPVEKPILSVACNISNGIRQETVNKGIVLPEALRKFEDWFKKAILQHKLVLPKTAEANRTGKWNCAFLTMSNLIGPVFSYECVRKSIRKPLYFNQYISFADLDEDVGLTVGTMVSTQAIEDGIRVKGIFRSRGIDIARNVARVYQRLINIARDVKIEDMTPNMKEINI